MLTGGRINRKTNPWSWQGAPGVMAWSDASGLPEQEGWTWGCVLRLPGRDDVLLAQGECPDWVIESTTAELWGLTEAARLVVREAGPNATAALVSDNTFSVFALVSVLRGSVPTACRGPARDAAEGALCAAMKGEGTPLDAARAKACLELAALGSPTVLRAPRETAELQIADHLARTYGGFRARQGTVVQTDLELRRFMQANGL